MLGGRVKTLHPRIHAGILARREVETDLAALDEHGIGLFDLVCVNLYPFEQVAREHGVREEEAVEMIDIGGPSMLRGAAKNFAHVTPLCRPDDYEPVLAELREAGEISLETRRRLAATRSRRRPRTRRRSRRWFAGREAFPPVFTPVFEKQLDLAYGENPHQGAAYYAERGVRTHLLARVEQLHGRELSFNNLNDLDAARLLVREFALPACVIVKHANPCGVAVGASIEEAYEIALAADPLSAYGGVVVLNRAGQRRRSASGSRSSSSRCCSRPATTRSRSTRSSASSRSGSSTTPSAAPPRPWERDYKRVLGGLLVQDRDWDVEDREGMEVVDRRADRGAVGRPALRRARLQARRLERDRDRQGPADDRDRRRPDEPRRRRPDRAREGRRARPLARPAPRSPPTRSSPSPTARGSRSTRA